MTGVSKYRSGQKSIRFHLVHRTLVVIGAVALTLAFFLVLPVIQAINAGPETDSMVYDAGFAELPPPPPPPPEDEPEPDEPEDTPEDLSTDEQLLDLSQLELALSSDLSGGWGGAGFGQIKLPSLTGGAGSEGNALEGLAIDQEARATHKQSPAMNSAIRKRIQSGPATVWIAFIVDEGGRVQMPRILSSPDRVFEGPALTAIKKWRFEPARRNGKPVRWPMKLPITFRSQ